MAKNNNKTHFKNLIIFKLCNIIYELPRTAFLVSVARLSPPPKIYKHFFSSNYQPSCKFLLQFETHNNNLTTMFKKCVPILLSAILSHKKIHFFFKILPKISDSPKVFWNHILNKIWNLGIPKKVKKKIHKQKYDWEEN